MVAQQKPRDVRAHTTMSEYDDNCAGCDISRGVDRPRGGVLRLAGGWLVNQYGGSEGFLGWLALQPDEHRLALSALTTIEQRALGEHLVALDRALAAYWKHTFPADPLEQVYFTFFYESRFDEPDPASDPSMPYHIHIHVIPRTQHAGRLLRENHSGTSIINAWQVWRLKESIPSKYRRPPGNEEWDAAAKLMGGLKDLLPESSFLPPAE